MPKNPPAAKRLDLLKQLPPEISNSPLLARRKLTTKQLPKYVNDMVRLITPELVPNVLLILLRKVRAGDMKAVSEVLKMYGLTPTPGGISVVNNIQQVAANGMGQTEGLSFDTIARQLDETRRTKVIEAHAEPMEPK